MGTSNDDCCRSLGQGGCVSVACGYHRQSRCFLRPVPADQRSVATWRAIVRFGYASIDLLLPQDVGSGGNYQSREHCQRCHQLAEHPTTPSDGSLLGKFVDDTRIEKLAFEWGQIGQVHGIEGPLANRGQSATTVELVRVAPAVLPHVGGGCKLAVDV